MELIARQLKKTVLLKWAQMLKLRQDETAASTTREPCTETADTTFHTTFRPAPFLASRRSSSGLGQQSGFWLL